MSKMLKRHLSFFQLSFKVPEVLVLILIATLCEMASCCLRSDTCMLRNIEYSDGTLIYPGEGGAYKCQIIKCVKGKFANVTGERCIDYRGNCHQARTLYKTYMNTKRMECYCEVTFKPRFQAFFNEIYCVPWGF
ncbi:uncharacterized protein LOC131943029 [Physella acuta]|uniref:uncharacterized protein LOC131943029 n=1 Tax=Physella acuta TaxID=109671 RepID=UPI0027DBFF63|nr:uncharacterized protein LOC131943029 [Physella acuta]